MSTFRITAPDGRVLRITGDTMPTEQELDEIFLKTGTNQSVMDNRDGKVYNVPVAMDGIDTQFAIDTQHKGADKGSFFGKIATFLPLAGEGAKQLVKDDFANARSFARGVTSHIGALSDTAIEAGYHYQDKVTMLQEAERGDFSRWGNDLSEEQKKEILEERRLKVQWVKDLRQKNRQFWENTSDALIDDERMTDMNRLFAGVAEGAMSVTEQVGLTMATKNPLAAAGIMAGVYGKMRNTEYFDKAIEAGMDAEEASSKALVAGSIESGLELVGDAVLAKVGKFKAIRDISTRVLSNAAIKAAQRKIGQAALKKMGTRHTDSVFGAALKGFASEGLEEGSQSAVGMFYENMTGVSDYSVDEVLSETLFSSIVGGLTGGLTGAGGTGLHNQQIRNINNRIKSTLKEQTPELTEEESQVMADAVQEMLFQESGNYTKEMNKIVKKEMQPDVLPEGLTADKLLTETRKLLSEKYGMSEEDIDKTVAASLAIVDGRNQFNEAYTAFYDMWIDNGGNSGGADATARLLAARALTIAREEKGNVKDVLKRWSLQFKRETAGKKEQQSTDYEQAMYKSPLTDMVSFYNDVLENPGKKKRYFSYVMSDGTNIDIMSDVIAHDQKHDMTADNWQEVLDNLDNVENFVVSDRPRFDGQPVLMKIATPGGKYGVVFERLRNGRNIITTAFKGTDKGIDNWIKKETAKKQSPNVNAADALPSQPVALEAENASTVAFASQQSEISDNPIGNNANRSFRNIIAALDENVNNPLYQESEAPRGAYAREGENSIIYLFENEDPSTIVHELGHFFLDDLQRFGKSEKAAEQLRAIYDYVGSTDGKLTKEQHEKFADSFEVYLLEGRSPNQTLAKVFARFKKWLRALWEEVRRLRDIKLTDEMRKTFGDLLGGRSLDFTLQMSSLKMAESLQGDRIPANVVQRTIDLLQEGKISKTELDELIEKMNRGELKRKDFASALKPFETVTEGSYINEKKTRADIDEVWKKLSAGSESAKKALYLLKVGKMSKADIETLIEKLEDGSLSYFDYNAYLKRFEQSNVINSEVVTDSNYKYYKKKLEAEIVDYGTAVRAVNMLKEGKISKKILNDILDSMVDGDMSPRSLSAEISKYDVVIKKNAEALNPFDAVKYRSILNRGQFKKSDVTEKINRLLKWTEPRTSGGKLVGRFPNKKLNDYFDHIRELMALSKEQARDKIEENTKIINDFIQNGAGENIDNLVFDNKVLSIPAQRTSAKILVDVYNAISESYNLGRVTSDAILVAKRRRKARMIAEAEDVLTDGGRVNWRKQRGKLRQAINKLGVSQMSWSGLLDILSMNDKNSRTGESLLNRNLDVFEAEQAEARGVAEDGEAVSRLIGDKIAGAAQNKGISVSRYVNSELQKEYVIEWHNSRRKFTKDQLLDIYMKAKDPETRKIMVTDEVLKFDEAFLSEVNQNLTAEDRAFADALFEFYDRNHAKMNDFYEEKYGVSLPKSPFYSPRSIETSGIDVQTGDLSSYAGFSGVKKRTAKAGTIKIKGAFAVLQDYIVNSNHWLAWADKLIDINGVMGDVKIKNIISNLFGEKMNARISYEISRMASNDKFQKNWFASETLNKIRSNYAVSVLALKPALAIKQLTSFPAYWEHMSVEDFMAGLADFVRHPKQAMEILGNTTLMKSRDVNIIKDFAELSKMEMFKKNTNKVKFRELMMLNIKLGDRGAIYFGGWALYKAELKKNLAAGMNEEQAKAKALEKFERVTDETQQSGRLSQQSYWQSNPMLRMFTMFQSSQNQYLRKEINAVRGMLTGRMDKTQAVKSLFIFHVLLPCLFQVASDGFEWDKKALLRAGLLGSLNGIFILNSILEKGLDIALGTDDSWQATRLGLREILPPWATFEDIGAFFVKLAEDDVDAEDVMRAMKSFGELTGLPGKYPLDVIQNLGSYAEEGEYKKEVLLWLGWSPYALREKDED